MIKNESKTTINQPTANITTNVFIDLIRENICQYETS